MYELPRHIPDIQTVLEMEPEELGAKLLHLMRERIRREQTLLHLGNQQGEPFGNRNNGEPTYPDAKRDEFFQAFAEAWSWLEAQGLLITAPGSNGSNGFRVLSRRAQKFEDTTDLAKFAAARRLPRDALHSALAPKVWSAFMRGEYDVAVLQAMKAVEVAVRAAAGLGNDLVGVALMTAAFREGGPLSDPTVEKGEQVARMNLFAGAMGSYKNPHSHRDIQLDDPAEAIEIVLLANHLLRIVDARSAARLAE